MWGKVNDPCKLNLLKLLIKSQININLPKSWTRYHINQIFVVGALMARQSHDISHVVNPFRLSFVELLQSQPWTNSHHLISVHSCPWDLHLKKKQSQVTNRFKVILSTLRHTSDLIVASKWATSINWISHFNRMSSDIDIPFSSFEIDNDELSFIIKHEMLWLNVTIQIPTIMDEFHNLNDISQDISVR